MTISVLLVDDDRAVRDALGQSLELADLQPTLAASFIEAKDHISPGFSGVIVSDIRMPGKDGFDLLAYTKGVDPDLPVILLTGEADIPMAVRGISAGAFAFLEKPCAPQDLVEVVRKALKSRHLVLENRRMKRQLEAGDAAERILFGRSDEAKTLRDQARLAARSNAEVLIAGEPGSGTSKVAEVIHLLSSNSSMPFVKHAAAALEPTGLEAAFVQASHGTLFLDEVAALPSSTQYALLETLENGTSTRVIAGTYGDIRKLVEDGRFSHDLYYRLNLVGVRIPSLRERAEDIPVLFRHYVAIACEQAALPVPDIDQALLARLMAQDWPGNARALMNVAMRFAMGLSDDDDEAGLGLSEQLARVERSLLIEALSQHSGHATAAAKSLKLPRKTFYDKLAKYEIRAEAFRFE